MYEEAFQHLRTTVALFGLKEIADSMDRACDQLQGFVRTFYAGSPDL